MRLAAGTIATFLIFLLLTGALGLRADETDCNTDKDIKTNGQLMNCYHMAAVTKAYVGDAGGANTICDDIWIRFGANVAKDGSDQRKKAEAVANACFYDIARITRQNQSCYLILEHDSYNINLFGSAVSRSRCLDDVSRLAKISPENYYQTNKNNLCSILFVFPAILGLAFVLGPGRR